MNRRRFLQALGAAAVLVPGLAESAPVLDRARAPRLEVPVRGSIDFNRSGGRVRYMTCSDMRLKDGATLVLFHRQAEALAAAGMLPAVFMLRW